MRSRLVALTILATAGCSLDWNSLDPSRGGGSGGSATASGGSAGNGGDASGGALPTGGGGQGAQGGMAGAGGAQGGGGAGGGEPLGPWDPPTPFIHNASGASDDNPSFTADGLELYFNSDRLGSGDAVLVCVRSSRSAAWGAPQLVPELSPNGSVANPVVAPDGLTLWVSGRFDGQPEFNRDIYVSTRPTRQSMWSAPMLVAELNETMVNDFPGSVSPDGLTMIMERDTDLYVATRNSPAAAWGTPTPISELNTGAADRQAWLAHDGLSIYFDRGLGAADLFMSTRASTSDPWLPPTVIAELSTADADSDAWLSPDERYIMFTRGFGSGTEIYEATR